MHQLTVWPRELPSLTIEVTLIETPWQPLLVGLAEQSVVFSGFVSSSSLSELQPSHVALVQSVLPLEPNATVRPMAIKQRPTFEQLVTTKQHVQVVGTAFQERVWRQLLTVASGQVVHYGDLAKRIGKPSAARAVGTALARNPIAVLLPCHRVLPKGGGVGQYRWGSALKAALLASERDLIK